MKSKLLVETLLMFPILFSKLLHSKNSHIIVRNMVKFLAQQEAIDIDVALFNEYKFSVDQLMELAGLSCASAIVKCYPNNKKVIICCGPGNNGGDGLVCARHLRHFGFVPCLYYPKRTDNELYKNLTHQCVSLDIPIIEKCPSSGDLDEYGLVVDALFGFSFKPPVRPDFIPIMEALRNTETPICSIDIPSSWHVETGPDDSSFHPDSLISLTAPKMCARFFKGRYHFLGGRFVPPSLAEKYELKLPQYQGTDNIIELK